ncbi:PepSY domain-containing protein [Paucisalibacillus sp. EB02]|uniref:PepSY domain-containing protein n=1 Tax=Paucisalibacillus sp. EB02 TaxID=1347087 RepID=UPI0004BA7B02|nr:PepSY domain-containing protein [Paucisalibacillus sp. EB02]
MGTKSSKTPWIIILVLTAILVIGLLATQPISKDEAIEIAKELAPDEYTKVEFIEFIPMNETEFGGDIWHIQLENKEADKAILKINARNGNMIEGKIEDGETGEVLDAL